MANTQLTSFPQYASPLRERIDGALRSYLRPRDGCPEALREAIGYGLLAPGKRLRPTLVLLAAEAVGGASEAAMPAACAVEMIHAYSLLHDDLPAMDDDDLRRGRPTCHKVFGEALAILTGDALLTLAFENLTKLEAPPRVVIACCNALAEAAGACQLVGGQADDIEAKEETLEQLESIHRRKTGAMILAALRLGALIAGADPRQQEALNQYGRRLGLAFQITDDLLDVQGEERAVGKRLGKDAKRGKLTFPGLLGVDESTARAEQLILEAGGALAPFDRRVERLESLARYVLERNR